jgi:hypothetical protein
MHKYKCENVQKIHNCASELSESSENSELCESSEFSENDGSSTGGKACVLNPHEYAPHVRSLAYFFQVSATIFSPRRYKIDSNFNDVCC